MAQNASLESFRETMRPLLGPRSSSPERMKRCLRCWEQVGEGKIIRGKSSHGLPTCGRDAPE
eukprot:249920-Alexandrium_andersonii.AAC.1